MNSFTALLAKSLERFAWRLEDLALELNANATKLEWEKEWEMRGSPIAYFDSDKNLWSIR